MQYRKTILFMVLAALFICIFSNRDLPSVNNMEARNYITAREILENGTWLLPTMNGEPRIAKPPLPTWITALFMKWAGTDTNLEVNRIPAGICGALLALFTFLLVRRVSGGNELAVTAVLVLVTGQLFFTSARRNFWDIYAHMAMAGALWAMIEAFLRKEGKALWFALFSLFLAFSFCSKGPIALGVMFLPFVGGYCLVYGAKDLKENAWGLALGLVVAVAVASAWPLYVYLNTPQNALAVASKETANWFTYHIQAPWYYLTNLHWIAGIWLPFLLYAVIAPFVQKNWGREEKLFLYWFLLTILVLSIVPEKKVRYLLPAVVPGAIITAVAVLRLREAVGTAQRVVYGVFCFATGAACFAAAGVAVYRMRGNLFLVPAALALAAAGAAIFSDYLRKRTARTHLTVIAALCLLLVGIIPLKQTLLPKDETRILMGLREAPELKGKAFYFLGTPPEELIYAAGKKVKPVKPDEVPVLEGGGASGILITSEPMEGKFPRLTPLRSIQTDDRTFYLYGFPGKGKGGV